MGREYLIVPDGFSPDNISARKLEELHRKGPNEQNAEIVILDNGITWMRAPYRGTLAHRLDAELPELPVHYRIDGEEKKETLGKPEPPELRRGVPPIKQILHQKCGLDGMELEEIYDYVFEDLEWFPRTGEWKDEIKSILGDLMGENMVLQSGDTYHTYPDSEFVGMGEEGYPIQEGEYPVCRLIRDKTGESWKKKRELVELVYVDWHWVSSRDGANYWIQHCLNENYIREIEKRKYEADEKIR